MSRNLLAITVASLLAIAVTQLLISPPSSWGTSRVDDPAPFFSAANEGQASLTLRAEDYPRTYISAVAVTYLSTGAVMDLEWSGPLSAAFPTGPFPCSLGTGTG